MNNQILWAQNFIKLHERMVKTAAQPHSGVSYLPDKNLLNLAKAILADNPQDKRKDD